MTKIIRLYEQEICHLKKGNNRKWTFTHINGTVVQHKNINLRLFESKPFTGIILEINECNLSYYYWFVEKGNITYGIETAKKLEFNPLAKALYD